MEWIITVVAAAGGGFLLGRRIGFKTGQDKGFMEGLMVNRWRSARERDA